MFHVKPRQIQPGPTVLRGTGDAPGVQSIDQHFRRVARRTVAAPQSASRTAASRTAAPRAAQTPAVLARAVLARAVLALAVLALYGRCPATPDTASLARTHPARLPVSAPEAGAAPAKAILSAARSQASRHARVPVPRDFPADAVLADADLPAPTMAQPPVPCPLGQNLIPRCLAVQFLVRRNYSSARYLAAQSPAARSRTGLGPASGFPAHWRCQDVRVAAW
jgi:hypothetical protein